jgi:hypothetical protein
VDTALVSTGSKKMFHLNKITSILQTGYQLVLSVELTKIFAEKQDVNSSLKDRLQKSSRKSASVTRNLRRKKTFFAPV